MSELIELAEQGNLKVEKIHCGCHSRRIRIYSKTKGEIVCGKFFGYLEDFKRITYDKFRYLAQHKNATSEHWRIRKKDFDILTKIIKQKNEKN